MIPARSQWGIWLASQPDAPLRPQFIRSTQPIHGLRKEVTTFPQS
jgi:hypothetical protein